MAPVLKKIHATASVRASVYVENRLKALSIMDRMPIYGVAKMGTLKFCE